MKNNKEILAIIPARSGSKGIKNKNIRMFNGWPMIAYTIKAAQKIPAIGRIVVSTDSPKIKAVAEKYGAEVPFLRSSKLARDSSLIVDVVAHLLKKLDQAEKYKPDYLLLLQPPSPLRTVDDIKKAIKLFVKTKADSLASVCQTENLLLTKDKNHRLKFLNPEFLTSTNRQQLPDVYKLDGCMINMIKTDIFLKEKSFMAGKFIGYEVERWRAIDIDEPQDFVVGELIHKNYDKLKKKIKNFK